MPYDFVPETGEWLIATGAERALIERLARDCVRLDDPSLTSGIIVGIQTSADHIYHLERLGTGRYKGTPKGKGAVPYEVEIEDTIMKPLVSGPEAKRYEEPETDTYLLFPYERDAHGIMRLIPANDMALRFPRAWAHLRRWEENLRRRENGKMDRDEDWWGYVYLKNMAKQDLAKLIVPRLVEHLKCSWDAEGRVFLDNVDAGGILPAPNIELEYPMAVLNGPVADFVFRIIAKPFQNDYRSANKQFIAPLPVPNSTDEERASVAARARRLQHRWTHRRHLLQEADNRLSVLARTRHPARWLWPDLPTLPKMTEQAPRGLRLIHDRRKWAKERLDEMEAVRIEALQSALDRGGRRQVRFDDGELRLYVSGTVVLDKIYLDEPAGRLTEVYWRWLLLSGPAREAERFASDLRRPPAVSDAPAAAQFIERVAALAEGCGDRGRRACTERNAIRALRTVAGRTKSCGERPKPSQRGAGGRVNLAREPHMVARMSQLPLFPRQRAELVPRPPDVPYIRKSLNRLLRLAREAQIMPWSNAETEGWEKLFPELAASLPAEEAETLTSEFRSELVRLRSTG